MVAAFPACGARLADRRLISGRRDEVCGLQRGPSGPSQEKSRSIWTPQTSEHLLGDEPAGGNGSVSGGLGDHKSHAEDSEDSGDLEDLWDL
ncbi:hypothetical protein EYF80_057391 [Liparis tanakae]|uniref:Uncharacterized protein n=1 Tax=Liparis tanakae TaxID=230148 RepID=A0A4Z2EUG9_9TELE|nr:hypothetical protein EYF80_057391 [Liparis tanakae]